MTSLGPEKQGLSAIVTKVRNLEPRVRFRLMLALFASLAAMATFAACGGCGKRMPAGEVTAAAHAAGDAAAAASGALVDADAFAVANRLMWSGAEDGECEDLAALAVHEGAMGLVEATSIPELRETALKAMGYAAGFAQLPFLAKVAGGKNDDEARLALAATVELAARPRRAEDVEDADELREGCEGLFALARDKARPKWRRASAVRALRMMPCPPSLSDEGLPSDVDAK